MTNDSVNTAIQMRDLLLAVALACALGIVFLLDGSTEEKAPSDAQATTGDLLLQRRPKPMRMAVIPEMAEFDDMGRLLDSLGTAYGYRRTDFDALLDPTTLLKFDIVFITCSGYPENWLGDGTGEERRGSGLYRPNPETFAQAKAALRGFVSDGGTLYASDLHYSLIAECFPEFVDYSLVTLGAPQTVQAKVIDPGLQEEIGSTIELTFDQEKWASAALTGPGMTTYLEGSFKDIDGMEKTSPLLVKLPHGKGSVIFTSFHNEKQNSDKERQLLEFLVFSAVTAGVDAEAGRQMAQGGFSATKKNLFAASKDAESVTQTYENQSQTDLQFVLAFPDQGATLELSVTGPDGATIRKQGSATITIDAPAAAAGSWTYSIKAIAVPSQNFPFTITVGKKK
jgi:hypothetical protein